MIVYRPSSAHYLGFLIIAISCMIGAKPLHAQTDNPKTFWVAQHPQPTGSNLRWVKMFDSSSYIICGEFGTICRTTNDGESWVVNARIVGSQSTLNCLDFSDRANGVAVGDGGVIAYTIDSGKSWTRSKPITEFHINAVTFVTPSRLCAVGNFGRLLFSDDTGRTWRRINLEFQEDLRGVTFTSPSTGYVICSNGYILATSDSGTTWTTRHYEFANHLYKLRFAPNGKDAIMCGELGGVFISVDSALNFTQRKPPITSLNVNDVAFIRDGKRMIACGDRRAIFISDDSGKTMPNVYRWGYDHLRSISFCDDRNGVLVGDWGFIARTYNGADSIFPLFERVTDERVALHAVKDFSNMTSIAAGFGGLIVKTLDGGKSWKLLPTPTLFDLYALHFVSSQIGYAVGDYGTILKTTDAGESWIKLSAPTDTALTTVAFFDEMNGIAGGDFGTVLLTSDGGMSWSKVFVNNNIPITGSAFIDKNTVLITGGNYIYRSTNGGSSFSGVYHDEWEYIQSVTFSDKLIGYAAGWHDSKHEPWGKIWKTTNGGMSWNLLFTYRGSRPEGGYYHSISSYRPGFATAVGRNGLTHHTTDGGATWSFVESGTGLHLYGVSHGSLQSAHAVGVKTLILKLTTDDVEKQSVKYDNAVAHNLHLSNYPNPVIDATTFSIRQEKSSEVSLLLFNINGERLDHLFSGFLPQGEHTVGWDASRYAEGTYFALLETSDGIREMIKVIVVK